MQSDMSLSNDSFVATVTNQDAVIFGHTFAVEVVPLTKQSEPFVCAVEEEGGKAPVLKRHLDATQLAGLTNSNPVYFLVGSPPQYGRIMRVVKPSSGSSGEGGLRDKEVWQFTHEDVKNGVVHYVVDDELVKRRQAGGGQATGEPPTLNDSFTFR